MKAENDQTGLGSDASRSKAPSSSMRKYIGDRVVIYRTHASPKWYVQWNENNKQYRKSLKTTSQKEAESKAAKIGMQLLAGESPEKAARAMKLDAVVEEYLRALRLRNRQPATIAIYEQHLNQLKDFCAPRGVVRLDQFSAGLLEEYQLGLAESGLPDTTRSPKFGRKIAPNSPRTVRSKLKTIKSMFKWAARRGHVKVNPIAGFELPPKVRSKVTPWSSDQLAKTIAHAEDEYRDVFNFLRLTGIRSDELCWLTKEDFDAERSSIKIRCKDCPQTGRKWRPKHGNERVVPLCAAALEIANRAIKASPGPWMFWAPHTRGAREGHYTPHRLWRALKRARKAGGVGHGWPHLFRHAFCSFLANEGVSPFLVMQIMGHDSLEIVLQYYHPDESKLHGAISGLAFEKMLPNTFGKEVKPSEVPADSQ